MQYAGVWQYSGALRTKPRVARNELPWETAPVSLPPSPLAGKGQSWRGSRRVALLPPPLSSLAGKRGRKPWGSPPFYPLTKRPCGQGQEFTGRVRLNRAV